VGLADSLWGGAIVQQLQRLSALAVNRTTKPGLYADGGGLYLRVGRNGAKRWAFRFMLNSRQHEMGFGGLNKVSLADARKKAGDARLLLSEGRSPLIHRHENAEKQSAKGNRSMTFDQCAEVYISAHEVVGKTRNIASNGEIRSRHMFLRYLAPLQSKRSTPITSLG
jgi:hypothetical protein